VAPHSRLDSAVQDPSGVLSGIFGGGNITALGREGLRRAALDSLKRLVERHLDSPALSAEFVCARSGWSRATVYRLFEAEGGLTRYIRKRRLLRALRELMSGQQPYRRIVDLAIEHQFSSEATFNRAFRRAFGIPPGKVRDLATKSRAGDHIASHAV
jgi:AraC-like DNA-binding protein